MISIQEQQVGEILRKYLPTIEKENSILKGNLLDEKIKAFIVSSPNAFVIGLISDQSLKQKLLGVYHIDY